MTDKNKNDDGSASGENIFQIMDGIIAQINKTKKIFIALIIAHLIGA